MSTLQTVEMHGLTVPIVPGLHQKVYAAAKRPDALCMGQWHCGTSHCRAGHIVDVAGKAGYALESKIDSLSHSEQCALGAIFSTTVPTALAALMIVRASQAIKIKPGRFYHSDEAALADMQRCADEEAALAAGQVVPA